MKWLLWPASLIWNAAARLRSWAYRGGFLHSRRLPGTVISVGNLTAGGTGKTPMVLWLAERLHEEGRRVGILTRGYRGEVSVPGGMPQSDEVAIYRERLKHRAELGVGANRYLTGEALSRHGVETFILDDGFQHLQLFRDVDIVLLDATDPFGGRHMLPMGLLREPASALGRADIVVITRGEHAPGIEAGVRRYTKAPIFYAMPELEGIFPLTGQSAKGSTTFDRNKSAFAFCGIGNPNAFFDDLTRWGIRVAGLQSFHDHHVYTLDEVNGLEAKARAAGAGALICTEKDVFNLRNVKPGAIPVFFARITLKVFESENFMAAVHIAINRGSRHSGTH